MRDLVNRLGSLNMYNYFELFFFKYKDDISIVMLL